MARTKQTARSQQSAQAIELDDEDQKEINDQLTEEDKLRRETLEKAPMQNELRHLEKKWTKKGKSYITEPKEDEDIPEQKINWYEKYALCVTREYDSSNDHIVSSSLHINSPPLKEILRDLIGVRYPGVSFLTSDVEIPFPPRSLYHYRQELKDILHALEPESEAAKHLPLLLDFISEHFEDAIKTGDNLREQGLVTYEHLWTIFRPGSLVYATSMGQPRVYKLNGYHYRCGMQPSLELSTQFVDFDGERFGARHESLSIPQFSGAVPIAELNALPLDMHPNSRDIVDLLTERGRRFESLAGQNFREYKGLALGPRNARFNIDGRVMIDAATFHRVKADRAFYVDAFPKVSGEKRKQALHSGDIDLLPNQSGELPRLTDDQRLLANCMVRGFSFTEKKFLDFFVDKLKPIEWNTKCFEQLVLPDSQKELVQALVAEHTARSTEPNGGEFDDIVKGKGRGLILVLHGPPGVGKTLTAECVAEFSRRPLYIVSSGDLGTDPEVLDERLSQTLDLASTWKAVLLIDEADVFLERRSLHDMARNGLVSIFLRTLEYYSGILFMTTNRVNTFDDAFKSRIHVPLKYADLPKESRLRVWKNFLANIDGGVDIDEEGYDMLSEGKLNGRQIKNVIRTAKSLAAYKKRRLDCQQLQQVMDIQMAFEADLDHPDLDIDMVDR